MLMILAYMSAVVGVILALLFLYSCSCWSEVVTRRRAREELTAEATGMIMVEHTNFV